MSHTKEDDGRDGHILSVWGLNGYWIFSLSLRRETSHYDRVRKSDGLLLATPTNQWQDTKYLTEMNKSRERSRKGRSWIFTMNGQGLLLVYKDNRIIAEKFFYDVLPSKVEVWTRNEENHWILALCTQEILPAAMAHHFLEPSILAAKPPASETPIDFTLAKASTSIAIDLELSPITWPSFEEFCKILLPSWT